MEVRLRKSEYETKKRQNWKRSGGWWSQWGGTPGLTEVRRVEGEVNVTTEETDLKRVEIHARARTPQCTTLLSWETHSLIHCLPECKWQNPVVPLKIASIPTLQQSHFRGYTHICEKNKKEQI